MTSHTNRSETRTNYSNGSKYSNNGGRRDRDRDRDRDRYGNGNRTQSRHGQPRLNPRQSTSTSVPRFENPLCAHVPDTDADTDSYPLLVVDSKYMNVCRGKEESENKPAVNVYDPTHWRGSVWVGPMFIRLNAATQTQTQTLKLKLKIRNQLVFVPPLIFRVAIRIITTHLVGTG